MERGAEVSAIDNRVAGGLGVVEVFASRAVQLYGRGVCHVGLAHGEKGVRITHHARAFAEVGLFELLKLCGEDKRLGAARNACGEEISTIFARPRVVTM